MTQRQLHVRVPYYAIEDRKESTGTRNHTGFRLRDICQSEEKYHQRNTAGAVTVAECHLLI